MKRFYVALILAVFTVFATASFSNSFAGTTSLQEDHGKKHGFGVKQYDAFHDVLHPLQHDAFPKNDFQSIRTKSSELARRGKAIVKLGVPHRTSAANRPEFSRELKKFSEALTKFRNDARRGTDDQLKTSYSAVHDSFEMLAALLPRG